MSKYNELRKIVGHPCLIFFTGLDGDIYDATGCAVSLVHHWLTLADRQDGTQIDLPGEHIIHLEAIE